MTTTTRNSISESRRTSPFDLVRPAFVILLLALLPVALLEGRGRVADRDRGAAELQQGQDRAGAARTITHQG